MDQLHTRLITVVSVDKGSAAQKCGLRSGDKIISVNDSPVKDEFDFRFHAACDTVRMVILRENIPRMLCLDRSDNTLLGIHFAQPKLKKCGNKCIFCFVDQMPKGLRKSLYIKDEDLGYSFTNGNYVTLSTTPNAELSRLAKLGMSPLFISVHATDTKLRRALLCNPRAYDIMEQLRFGAKEGLSFHTQIVVCPGYNDGSVLARSIRDLLSLKHGLLSIAVVPVGLTSHRKIPLTPVNKDIASAVVDLVSPMSDADTSKNGNRRLFCADEFFIKAEIPIPQKRYYEEYPQIENGVGLVRQLLDEWTRIKRGVLQKQLESKSKRKNVLIVTSESAAAFLKRIVTDCNNVRKNDAVGLCVVKNNFFGGHVSVAGLLTASDIFHSVKQVKTKFELLIVPHIIFNYQGFTLDGYSPGRMQKMLGVKLTVADSLSTMVSNL